MGKKGVNFWDQEQKPRATQKMTVVKIKKARGTKKSVTNTHAQKKLEAFRNNSSDMMIK